MGPMRVRAAERGGGDHRQRADDRDEIGRIAEQERDRQHHERDEEQPARAQGRPDARNRVGIHAAQAELERAEMHLGIDADIIKQRRQDRGEGDLAIFDADILGHDEGGRAHDRRQHAAARRRRDLDRGRERARIAEPAHHRNGDGAGRHHVGGRAAGDGAVEARGDDRDLGRAARAAAAHRGGDVEEELAAAGRGQHAAEHDEEEGIGRGDAQRQAHDAVGRVDHDVDEVVVVDIAVAERARQQMAEEIIADEDEHHDQQAEAGGAARRLERQREGERAEDHVPGGQLVEQRDARHDIVGAEGEIDAAGEREGRQHQVDDRQLVLVDVLGGADRQEHQVIIAPKNVEVSVHGSMIARIAA